MLLRMIGQIKVSGNRFRCVFVVFFYIVRRGGVLGICRLVVSLFRRCITFCKECKLYSSIINQRHLLYNLHSLQKVIHRRNRETTGDRFREHLRDVEKDDKNASKPVARHFNLPNHSKQHMVVCGLSLHQGSTESRKTIEQKFIFQIGTLNPHGINERFSFH